MGYWDRISRERKAPGAGELAAVAPAGRAAPRRRPPPDPRGASQRRSGSRRSTTSSRSSRRRAWSAAGSPRSAPGSGTLVATTRSGTRPTRPCWPTTATGSTATSATPRAEIGTLDLIVFVFPDRRPLRLARRLAAGRASRTCCRRRCCNAILQAARRGHGRRRPGRHAARRARRRALGVLGRAGDAGRRRAGRRRRRTLPLQVHGLRLSRSAAWRGSGATLLVDGLALADAPRRTARRPSRSATTPAGHPLRRLGRRRARAPASCGRSRCRSGWRCCSSSCVSARQLALRGALGPAARAGAAGGARPPTAARPSSCRTSATSSGRR